MDENEYDTISLGRTTVRYADFLTDKSLNVYTEYNSNAQIITDKDAVIDDFISENFDMTRDELTKFVEKYEPERTIW